MERLMQVITPDFVKGKRVILRSDIDVLIEGGGLEEFRLEVGLPTLRMCLEYGSRVTMIGHLGRPDGQVTANLSVEPVRRWFTNHGFSQDLTNGKLEILENLRFDPRESFDSTQDKDALEFAKELAAMGDVYINEAFSAYRPAVSTTILPTLLPHAAGLHFTKEVARLTTVRENPKRPFVAIIGGVKVEDKLPAIKVLSQIADAVLVGGKIASQITETSTIVEHNVMVGKLNEEGTDIAEETTESWRSLIMRAKMIVWNGPLGKFEDPKNNQTSKVAQIVVESEAESIIGGGDTISALNEAGLLDKFSLISVGGGAMLKFLAEGTLPTIEALK